LGRIIDMIGKAAIGMLILMTAIAGAPGVTAVAYEAPVLDGGGDPGAKCAPDFCNYINLVCRKVLKIECVA
jgi:hypothetical protein